MTQHADQQVPTAVPTTYPSHGGVGVLSDPNQIYIYEEPPSPRPASSGHAKHYFRVSSTDLFTYYNPRGAQVVLSTNLYTSDLYLAITPAIPNNPAVNIRRPVPAGTQVYNYDRKVVVAFAFHEIVALRRYLQKHILGEESPVGGAALATMPIQDVLALLNNMNMVLAQNDTQAATTFVNEWRTYLTSKATEATAAPTTQAAPPPPVQFANSSGPQDTARSGPAMGSANDPGVVLWRKGAINKRVSVNFDTNRQMFFFSAIINNDNANRAYTGMKMDYAEQFLTVVESYLNNYTVHKVVSALCNSIDMLTGFKQS